MHSYVHPIYVLSIYTHISLFLERRNKDIEIRATKNLKNDTDNVKYFKMINLIDYLKIKWFFF